MVPFRQGAAAGRDRSAAGSVDMQMEGAVHRFDVVFDSIWMGNTYSLIEAEMTAGLQRLALPMGV